MPIERTVATLLVSPVGEREALATRLSELGYFHVNEDVGELVDEELVERSRRLSEKARLVAEQLQIKTEVGVIDSILGGGAHHQREIEAESIRDLVHKLEEMRDRVLGGIEELLLEINALTKRLESLEEVRRSVEAFSRLRTSLEAVNQLRLFVIKVFLASKRDVDEIEKSLEGRAGVFTEFIEKQVVLCAVVADRAEREFVERVLKAFEVNEVRIPEGYPQTPSEAYRKVVGEIREVSARLDSVRSRLMREKSSKQQELEFFVEATRLVEENISRLRSPRLKNIAVFAGYIPVSKVEDFKKRLGGYIAFIEEVEEAPTVLRNNKYAKSFEYVTLTQGQPSPNEIDPTPIISVFFPVFYGFMFGDVGHGVVLALGGLLLRLRGGEGLGRWGLSLISFGLAAIGMGLLTGEVFGFPVYGKEGAKIAGVKLPLFHVAELSAEAALEILVVAISLGVLHLAMGLALDFYKALANGERLTAFLEKLPSLTLYVSGVLFAVAFISAGYDFGRLWSGAQTPLGLPVNVLVSIALPVIIVSSASIVASKPVEFIKLGHGEGLADSLIGGVIEWLLKVVEFLANTVSYARLAVLLLVHAALLKVVNMSFSIGLAGLPIVFIGNLGIILLEGLLVFIQDMRLHLYEWFTKFYEGSGEPFSPISLNGRRVRVSFRTRAPGP